MSNAINELIKLNFDEREWICELRNKVCEHGVLSEDDVQTAFDKLNSDIKLSGIVLPDTTGTTVAANKTLYKLYENTNAAGLYDNKHITFSPSFTLIYGKNGSGKTSYYKILKDAFHSSQDIIGNIYQVSAIPSTAKIDFVDKKKHRANQLKGITAGFPDPSAFTIEWLAGKQNPSHIKFCDDRILSSSLSKKDSGWSVDRYKLGYYDTLRSSVEEVEKKYNEHLTGLNARYSENFEILIKGLKSDAEKSIKKFLLANKDVVKPLTDKLEELSKLTLEADHLIKKGDLQRTTNMSVEDLTDKIDLATIRSNAIVKIQAYIDELISIYKEVKAVNDRIEQVAKLKKSLDFSKFNQFKLLFDPQVNKDKYVELLQKIAETALTFGFENYPDEVEKCFYCNQELPDENKSLIKDIHQLIDNEVNKEITQLQTLLRRYQSKVDKMLQTKAELITIASLGEIYQTADQAMIDFGQWQNQRFDPTELNLLKIDLDDLKPIDVNFEIIVIQLNDLLDMVQSEGYVIRHDLGDLKGRLLAIETLKKEARENLALLEDKEFCVNQKVLIEGLLKSLEDIKTCKKSGSNFQSYKMKISKDKGRVEEELIRNNYLQSFNKNLAYFEIARRDNIKRPFSNPVGTSKIDAKIEANNKSFSVSAILSEGEAKVYSICDWLTELEFDDKEILVFDDPITSLDDSNIYKVVDKIIDLSKAYQVVVFTHNFEFYHRLIQKSLGSSSMHKAKCGLCEHSSEADQCAGKLPGSTEIHKCATYYIIEHALQPGMVKEEVIFMTLDWEERIKIIRDNLIAGDITQADKHLRTTINNFFERFVLNDIKRQVYRNNDLIKEWRGMRDISEVDYNILMEVHNKISAEGTIHESSPEVRTALDVRGYIAEFNKAVRAINNIRSFNNPSAPAPIAEI